MITKSCSSNFCFLRYPSVYPSLSSDNWDQKEVSRSLIFLPPQTSILSQSRKQSLFYLEGNWKEEKGTHMRLIVMWLSESHLSSFFNLSRSKEETFPKPAGSNLIPITLGVMLQLMLVKYIYNEFPLLTKRRISHSRDFGPPEFCEISKIRYDFKNQI